MYSWFSLKNIFSDYTDRSMIETGTNYRVYFNNLEVSVPLWWSNSYTDPEAESCVMNLGDKEITQFSLNISTVDINVTRFFPHLRLEISLLTKNFTGVNHVLWRRCIEDNEKVDEFAINV